MAGDAVEPTIYVLLTHALLDRDLADDFDLGADDPLWELAQSLLQFEVNVHWLWSRPEDAAVWDDRNTAQTETRSAIVERALTDAVSLGRERYGDDLEQWKWGVVRPFVLRHPFAADDGILGWLLNTVPRPIDGGAETVFKQQFARSDREHMRSAVGPVVRFAIDMGDPWSATYSLAGGASGWPRSPFYANLLRDWRSGRSRPLTPPPSAADISVQFVPG
jgi:acyl-homoserine-lactone acylase